MYLPQVEERFHSVTENRTRNLCIFRQLGVPLWYQGVVLLYLNITSYLKFRYLQRGLIIDRIWRKRFFSKIVPVFRKYLSVSRWNLSGYFRVSFRFPQVTEFGKSTANRRRSTWPILFVSITQPCDVVPSERMLNISKRNLVECTSDLMVQGSTGVLWLGQAPSLRCELSSIPGVSNEWFPVSSSQN